MSNLALAHSGVYEPVPSTELYLEVVLNHAPIGGLIAFTQSGGTLHARAASLRALGFRLDGVPDERLVALSELAGLAVRFDNQRQRVELTAPLALLSLETTRLDVGTIIAPPLSPSEPGALFNYDLYAAHSRGSTQWSAAHETRVFGIGPGLFGNTMITRFLRTADSLAGDGWRSESVRLDTSWQHSWTGRMLTLQLGDSVTGSLGWTRAVRIGGIRIGSNFGLQPYRMTSPQPAFFRRGGSSLHGRPVHQRP